MPRAMKFRKGMSATKKVINVATAVARVLTRSMNINFTCLKKEIPLGLTRGGVARGSVPSARKSLKGEATKLLRRRKRMAPKITITTH